MIKCNLSIRHLLPLLVILMGFQLSLAQKMNITGTVTDPESEPLIGVSVTVAGTQQGVTSDLDGNYSISADSKGKLRFSYIGYKTEDVAVSGRNVINVKMNEDS